MPLELLAKSAYFSVSFGLLRWEVGGALSRATAFDEVKGEGRAGGWRPQICSNIHSIRYIWNNFLCLWSKEAPKERTGGKKEKQHYILSRDLCLTNTTLNKRTGMSPCGVWIRKAALLHMVKSHHWLWERAGSQSFCRHQKGIKVGEEQGSPIKLTLAPNTADRASGGFPQELCRPVSIWVGSKWGEARLKGLQTTPLKKHKAL